MAKQDDWTRITLRLPPDLHQRLSSAAEANSLNAVIVAALEEKYPAPPPSYRDLLTMALDYMIREGLTSKTQEDRDEVLANLDSLPEELREDTAKHMGRVLLESLDRMASEYREKHPTPTDD